MNSSKKKNTISFVPAFLWILETSVFLGRLKQSKAAEENRRTPSLWILQKNTISFLTAFLWILQRTRTPFLFFEFFKKKKKNTIFFLTAFLWAAASGSPFLLFSSFFSSLFRTIKEAKQLQTCRLQIHWVIVMKSSTFVLFSCEPMFCCLKQKKVLNN